MNSPLVCQKLSRRYGRDYALRDFSFRFPNKGFIAVLGPSGSGKSTLLNILSGLDLGYEGQIKLFGKDVKKQKMDSILHTRLSKIGYVFQSFRLLESETALGNVLFPVEALYKEKRENLKRRALDSLRFVAMEEKANQRVNLMSGGEKQRVAIARSLVANPSILLCDEPSGALDEANAHQVFDLLLDASISRLVIVVTHDEELAREYADRILTLEDGRLVKDETLTKKRRGKRIRTIVLDKPKKKARLPSFFLFVHAFHKLKAKKIRSLLSISALSMGLTGLGMSVYLSTSIYDELNASFSSLVPPNCLIMSPRSLGESAIGHVYSARFEDCQYLKEECPEIVFDYGSTLYMDYEEWFADDNRFCYLAGSTQNELPGLGMRSINEYLWLDRNKEKTVYPRPPVIMEEDEVILGLPYQNMWTMCLSLHIERSYQSLGDACRNGLPIFLYASNEAFGFYDEEVFSVIGVTESPFPCFYHLRHDWNRKIILDHMRFRSSLEEEVPTPQYVHEIPFVDLTAPVAELLPVLRNDPNLKDLVLEPASSIYLPSICPLGQSCDIHRYYLYNADKNGIPWTELETIVNNHPVVRGRQIVSAGGFYASADSLAMGFQGRFFLCEDLERATNAVDAYSSLPLAQASALIDLPPGTYDLSYLGSALSGIKISSDLSNFVSGAAPVGVEEIGLSTSLYEKLGKPESLFIAAEKSSDVVGERYEREFGIAEIKVTGYKQDSGDIVYLPSDWTVDFLFSSMGMSPFLLEPYGAVFYFQEGSSVLELKKQLEIEYPFYRFFSPSDEISTGIEGTLRYVSTILMAFSLIALLTSGLLFAIVMAITIAENASEADLLLIIGFSSSDIHRSFLAHCLLYLGSSLGISFLGVLLLEIMAKGFIANAFHSSPSSGLPLLPLLALLLAAVSLLLFIAVFLAIKVDRLTASKKRKN